MKSLIPVFGGLLFRYGWTHFNKEYFYNPKDNKFVIAEKILKNIQSGVVAVLVQSSILNETYFIQYEISVSEEVTRILIWFCV